MTTKEHLSNNQIKEQKLYFAMELTKQAIENIEDLMLMEAGEGDKRRLKQAILALEGVRATLKPIRSVYAILAEFKEVLNSFGSSLYHVGARLNQNRRKESPHRDTV